MGFSDALQGYIDAIGCTAKELADASGISQSSLSRYLSGDRVPYPGSATLAKLARGIEALSGQRGGMPAASIGNVPDLSLKERNTPLYVVQGRDPELLQFIPSWDSIPVETYLSED